MDETDFLLILLSVFLFCMCWIGYMSETKKWGYNKPHKKIQHKKTVDKADKKDMYGNWMYPRLHREKEIQKFIKEYSNL